MPSDNEVAELGFGYVKGRFLAAIFGLSDTDMGEAVSGYVRFTATTPSIKVTSAVPSPVTVFPQAIEINLNTDGYLEKYGSTNIKLRATNDADGNPVNWQWKVTFFLKYNGVDLIYPEFNFALPEGSTVDLTTVAPLATVSPGVIITKGDPGAAGSPGSPGSPGAPGADATGLLPTGVTVGTWQQPYRQNNSNLTTTAGQLRVWKMYIAKNSILDALSFLLVTVAASSSLQIVIYDDVAGLPGALRKASSVFDTSITTGLRAEVFADVSLPRGLYHIGIFTLGAPIVHAAADDATPFHVYDAGTGAVPSAATGNDARVATRASLANVPNPFGAASKSAGNNARAALWLRLRDA